MKKIIWWVAGILSVIFMLNSIVGVILEATGADQLSPNKKIDWVGIILALAFAVISYLIFKRINELDSPAKKK
ncbi:MAG: hypothetical protein ABSD10_02820 [Candidatus Saccharimonadales bacterium]